MGARYTPANEDPSVADRPLWGAVGIQSLCAGVTGGFGEGLRLQRGSVGGTVCGVPPAQPHASRGSAAPLQAAGQVSFHPAICLKSALFAKILLFCWN